MKSKFAKFIDRTLGAALLFVAATAVLRYYLPLYVAALAASAVTAVLYIITGAIAKKRDGIAEASRATEEMFYDFMFENERAPARLLQSGLKSRGVKSELHGNALYSGSSAAFFAFDAPPSDKDVARMVSRAAHYGKKTILVFCKTPPRLSVAPDGIKIRTVHGDDVYRLYASLGALPKRRFDKSKRAGKLSAYKGALDKDKIVKYLLLSASLFAVAWLTGFSIVTTACAGLAAALFVASAVFNIVKAVKAKQTD